MKECSHSASNRTSLSDVYLEKSMINVEFSCKMIFIENCVWKSIVLLPRHPQKKKKQQQKKNSKCKMSVNFVQTYELGEKYSNAIISLSFINWMIHWFNYVKMSDSGNKYMFEKIVKSLHIF